MHSYGYNRLDVERDVRRYLASALTRLSQAKPDNQEYQRALDDTAAATGLSIRTEKRYEA